MMCPVKEHDDEVGMLLTDEISIVNPTNDLCPPRKTETAAVSDVEVSHSAVINHDVMSSVTAQRRLVQKTGEFNVTSLNVNRRHVKYLTDLFTTLVEMRWRYHVVLFLVPFIVCWLAFTAVYLVIVRLNGDLDNLHNDDWVPCIHNVYDFTSAFLYSFETQTTIGYGSRVIDSTCHVGVVAAMLQIYIGTVINMLVTGLVFVKISRPKSRRQTIVFSHYAVVCRRNGQYQLLFRVGDMRTRSHLIGTSVRALLVKNILTSEGELIPLCQFSLSLETETGHNDSYIFLVWPVTVAHRIDSNSPLWDMSETHLHKEHFEIIVILEGTVELTGTTTQVRTSYLPSEIRWGECLVPLIAFQKDDGRYCIDFTQFHNTMPTTAKMPACSAKEWNERQQKDGTTAATQSDHPSSFRSSMMRSVSFPSQPTTRFGFLPVSRKKRQRKTEAKSGACPARCSSYTDTMHPCSTSPVLQQLPRPNTLSALTLRSPGSFTDSEVASPAWKVSNVRDSVGDGEESPLGRVHFQLEDIEENGIVCALGSMNDS